MVLILTFSSHCSYSDIECVCYMMLRDEYPDPKDTNPQKVVVNALCVLQAPGAIR